MIWIHGALSSMNPPVSSFLSSIYIQAGITAPDPTMHQPSSSNFSSRALAAFGLPNVPSGRQCGRNGRNGRIGPQSRLLRHNKRPVAAQSDGEATPLSFPAKGWPNPFPALSLSLSVVLLGGVDPAMASNLTAQGRGTAAELQSILEQRGTKLPALTSSPNERKVEVASKSGSSRELIQELRRQNMEIKELKAELEGVDTKKRAVSSSTRAPGPSNAAPAAPSVSVASDSSDGGRGALPVLNVLGIFAAAGLGGFLTLQRKDAEEAKVAYESKIELEQGIVKNLQDDLGSIKSLLDGEKAIVEKIKRESATASSEYARQLGLEKASKELVEKEKRLIEQSLSTEQRLAAALRVEGEKTSELLEAERAAKFAADAEATQLKAQLSEVYGALEEEKREVQKWQADTEQANKRLSEARSVNEALEKDNSALEEDLEERAARIAELNAAAAALQDQIQNANAVNASQSDIIARIGKETMNMQEAMSVMRAQAAERALAAHREREEAQKERERYEKEANEFRTEIIDAQNTIRRLEGEICDAKDEIQRANAELAATRQELSKAQESMDSMKQEISTLTDKIYDAEKALGQEQGDNVALRSQLAALQSEISGITSSLETERAEKQQLLDAVEQLREEYNSMSERVESEQSTVLSLRKEASELKKAIADLETKNRTLGSNLIQVEEQSRSKLADVEKRLEAAEKSSGTALSSRDDAYLAIDKLEGVIKMLQEDMAESEVRLRGSSVSRFVYAQSPVTLTPTHALTRPLTESRSSCSSVVCPGRQCRVGKREACEGGRRGITHRAAGGARRNRGRGRGRPRGSR